MVTERRCGGGSEIIGYDVIAMGHLLLLCHLLLSASLCDTLAKEVSAYEGWIEEVEEEEK